MWGDKRDRAADLRRVRTHFDKQLAEVLLSRMDLPHAQIAQQFGISGKVIQRVAREFNIKRRRRAESPPTDQCRV